jgi:SET domain-containing protein
MKSLACNLLIIGSLLLAFFGCADPRDRLLRPTLATLKHPPEQKFIGHEGIKELCERHLGMTYLYKTETDISELKSLTKHSLINSASYKHNKKRFGPQVKDSHIADIYVKFINDEIGYGLFANSDIKNHQLVGEYAGVIRKGKGDSTWTWHYPSDKFRSALNIPELSLDGKYSGNGMRFINHHDDANVGIEYLFSDGFIRLLYVSKKDIKKDEQLFINYGDKYWADRNKQNLN